MLWLLLSCSIGATDQPAPTSVTAVEAKKMDNTGRVAGQIAGIARELEAAAKASPSRLESGADPAAEIANLEQLVGELEQLEAELQSEHEERLVRIRSGAQSTAATKE